MRIKERQLEFLDWELGVFFHFGIRTFYEGHKDWDMREMPLEAFNPVQLDCRQWISTAKESGAKYAILVCKHHDGFAMYHSEVDSYNVVDATPFGRDVIGEIAEACRKHDLKLGIYYSQNEDWHDPNGGGYGRGPYTNCGMSCSNGLHLHRG